MIKENDVYASGGGPVIVETKIEQREIFIFDTTLRDGEQGSGLRLTPEEKLQIAIKLAGMGVKVIEVGFGVSSKGDRASIALVSQEVRNCSICALSRAVVSDVAACVEALEYAAYPRIHTGIGVSLEHIIGKFGDDKYGKTLDEKKDKLVQMAVSAVCYARKHVDDVEFYAEDAGRADRPFLYRMLEAVIDAGATVVNIPDTTGYTFPGEFGSLIRDIFINVRDIAKVIVSVHCHNDLGMGVGTTIEGLLAGATQAEVSLNGYGERAGNTPLEEVVVAIHTRGKEFGICTAIDIKQIMSASRLASRVFGVPIPPKKPIVGAKVFDHSSGIHQDGFLKDEKTYQIIKPLDIGAQEGKIVLTARSGSHALRHRLLGLGYGLSNEQFVRAWDLFEMVADEQRRVENDDLANIAGMILASPEPEVFSIISVSSAHDRESGGYKATITVRKNGEDVEWIGYASDGPIDAAVHAIREGMDTDFEIVDYKARSIGEGSDAPALVQVIIRHNGETRRGKWLGTDTVKASIVAYAYAVWAAQQPEQQTEAEFKPQRVGKYDKLNAGTRYEIPERPEIGFLVIGVGSGGQVGFFHTDVWKGGHRKSKKWTFHSIPPMAVYVKFPQYRQKEPGSRHEYGLPEFYGKDGVKL